MDLNKVRIVADSSSDILGLDKIPFNSAPLKIIAGDREFVDDKNLNTEEMVNYLYSYSGKSSTACPSPEDWLKGFADAQYVFCVSITSNLSGCYNTACIAKEDYEEKYPDRKVFVIDSLSTGPEMALIIEKLERLIIECVDFSEVCEKIMEYKKKTGLLFMLESMKNLANNGRVNPIVAKAAGILGIRIVGKASEKGTLEIMDKCRGERKALSTIVERIKELWCKGGKIKIAHCFNDSAANSLKKLIVENIKDVKIEIYSCRGLCSFYAEKGGMLIGFEK